jgi:hypothetical protein
MIYAPYGAHDREALAKVDGALELLDPTEPAIGGGGFRANSPGPQRPPFLALAYQRAASDGSLVTPWPWS